MNFLDHLDEWIQQAIDRASSVVAAKVIFFSVAPSQEQNNLTAHYGVCPSKFYRFSKMPKPEYVSDLYFEFEPPTPPPPTPQTDLVLTRFGFIHFWSLFFSSSYFSSLHLTFHSSFRCCFISLSLFNF